MPDDREIFHGVNTIRQILVVDDEMINREILSEYLKSDYDVLLACDGVEAMEMIRAHKETLSLILLDLLMPVMSGKEVLKELKESDDLLHIPVIVITADQESEVECLSLGAIDFIPKPYPQVGVVLARVLRTIELFEDRHIIQSTERDSLTGLYNKEFFYRYAEQWDLHHKKMEMDAILIDVSHFHLVNERYGKTYGDEVLRNVADALRKVMCSSGGILCRGSADTFMAYVPHFEDYDELLNQTVSEIHDDEMRSRIRLRMGVYSKADKSMDIESRFDRAKIAADTVRGSLTKMYGIYDAALHENEIFAEQLVEEFQTALEEKQFKVYFQPKFDVRPDVPVLSGAEALVRWDHPEFGLISPGVFIPLFEKNGLIKELDAYVWRETARHIQQWKKQYNYSVPVSVNVSRIDLYDPDMIASLRNILKTYELKAEDMELELTESAYTQDSAQIIEMVSKLRDAGFRIEMDDFGTGYSSLNMISSLPIDAMKLDMQFVRNAFKEGGDTRMLEVIIEIAAYLSVPVIAEGVETEEQLRALKTMGCDIIQGYYFSKPVPGTEFEPFILVRKEADETAVRERIAAEEKLRQKAREMLKAQLDPEKTMLEEGPELAPRPGVAERRQTETKGIHMRTVNYLFAVIAFIVAVSLYLVDSMVTRSYLQMEQANNHYIVARQAAADMESGSDYLTDRVRSFVITGDLKFMKDFFEEIEVTRRRDNALNSLEELMEGSDNSAYENLAAALQDSNELVARENLSMALMVEAGDYDPDEIPDVVANIELDEAYRSLSPDELRKKAEELVYDEVYMDYKDRISNNVTLCTESLIQSTREAVDQASARMMRLLRIQTILTAAYLIVVLGLVLFIRFEVRKPLTQMVDQMRSQKPVSPTGAEELRFVTRTYNEILLENKKAHAQLSYEASHDALTGLYNRGAYETLLKSIDMDHAALLMIDVDLFKVVNDTYGHDIGDRVLKRVAETLQHSFRSVDVICRIGGDEFVVIMTRANSSMRQLVYNKIMLIEKQLQNPKEDLPPTSLSVGVAFSDRKNPQGDIFKDADTALYRAKEAGKGRCEIY